VPFISFTALARIGRAIHSHPKLIPIRSCTSSNNTCVSRRVSHTMIARSSLVKRSIFSTSAPLLSFHCRFPIQSLDHASCLVWNHKSGLTIHLRTISFPNPEKCRSPAPDLVLSTPVRACHPCLPRSNHTHQYGVRCDALHEHAIWPSRKQAISTGYSAQYQ